MCNKWCLLCFFCVFFLFTTSPLTLYSILFISVRQCQFDGQVHSGWWEKNIHKYQSSDLFSFVPAIMEGWVIAQLSISSVFFSLHSSSTSPHTRSIVFQTESNLYLSMYRDNLWAVKHLSNRIATTYSLWQWFFHGQPQTSKKVAILMCLGVWCVIVAVTVVSLNKA